MSKYIGGTYISSNIFSQNWILSFDETGNYIIPPYSITLNGREYYTKPISVCVHKLIVYSDYKLQYKTEKEKYYVGELIPIMVKFLFRKEARELEFDIPLLDSEQKYIPYDEPDSSNDDTYVILYHGKKILAKHSAEILNGKQFSSLSFSFLYNGSHDLSSTSHISLNLKGVTSERVTKDIWGRSHREPVYSDISLQSQDLSFIIDDLPKKNRPPLYNGLIGTIKAHNDVINTNFKVGDPVKMSIEISGVSLSMNKNIPQFESNLNWSDFKVEKLSSHLISPDTLRVEYRIRPKDSSIDEIPPIEIPYFDPEVSKYEVFKIPPIKVKVSNVENVGFDLSLSPNDRSKEIVVTPGFQSIRNNSVLDYLFMFINVFVFPLFIITVILVIFSIYIHDYRLIYIFRYLYKYHLIKKASKIEKDCDIQKWLQLWDEVCLFVHNSNYTNLEQLKKKSMEDKEILKFINDWEMILYSPTKIEIKYIPARKIIRSILR
ncbi:BatD family protein [Spirochaeta cellobiosiphila]|uniref:BatD family protein n=1 Tax=Spirochaeta cellobiosiphila TaxID=504483 RepID=UPI001FE1F912|nr:BatD family protein [Spirochaeta cellobiosiphila]